MSRKRISGGRVQQRTAVAWKRIAPSLSSAKAINSLYGCRTLPVNLRSDDREMLSSGMCVCLACGCEDRVRSRKMRDERKVKRVDKTDFIDFDLPDNATGMEWGLYATSTGFICYRRWGLYATGMEIVFII